jgi:hypothetical protein
MASAAESAADPWAALGLCGQWPRRSPRTGSPVACPALHRPWSRSAAPDRRPIRRPLSNLCGRRPRSSPFPDCGGTPRSAPAAVPVGAAPIAVAHSSLRWRPPVRIGRGSGRRHRIGGRSVGSSRTAMGLAVSPFRLRRRVPLRIGRDPG